MTTAHRIYKTTRIENVPAIDVETFVREVLDAHGFEVQREYIDEGQRRIRLRFGFYEGFGPTKEFQLRGTARLNEWRWGTEFKSWTHTTKDPKVPTLTYVLHEDLDEAPEWLQELHTELEKFGKGEEPVEQSELPMVAAQAQQPTQKRGMQLDTKDSIRRLREIRLEAIENGRPIPKRKIAMQEAGITDKPWKEHDLELYEKWFDKKYR